MTEFNYRRIQDGWRRDDCKDCYNEKRRSTYRSLSGEEKLKKQRHNTQNRERAIAVIGKYLTGRSCVDCGETDPIVFEFDHVRGEKFRNVSAMTSAAFSEARLLEEVEKCDVVCANCHKRRTVKRQGSWRGRFFGDESIVV